VVSLAIAVKLVAVALKDVALRRQNANSDVLESVTARIRACILVTRMTVLHAFRLWPSHVLVATNS
jgi:hypothetical protein